MPRLTGSPANTWRQFVQRSTPLERRLYIQLNREFRRWARAAASNLLNGVDAFSGFAQHEERVARIIANSYRETISTFTKPIMELREVTLEMVDKEVAEMLREVGVARVNAINNTTRKQTAEVLATSYSEGLGTQETARRVQRVMGGVVSANRAQTIARTEVHTVANTAQHQAAEALEVPMKQEWIAAVDERTRTTHIDADGQVVGLGESFIVGGASMRFPGDPTAPPEETINCRCTVGFITE